MSRVLDTSGAQVLPHVDDERTLSTAWQAFVACNADQRAKHPEWREVAERLVVTK